MRFPGVYEKFSTFGDFFRSLLPDDVRIASDRTDVVDKYKSLRFILYGSSVRFGTDGSGHRNAVFGLLDRCIANGYELIRLVGIVVVRLCLCLP